MKSQKVASFLFVLILLVGLLDFAAPAPAEAAVAAPASLEALGGSLARPAGLSARIRVRESDAEVDVEICSTRSEPAEVTAASYEERWPEGELVGGWGSGWLTWTLQPGECRTVTLDLGCDYQVDAAVGPVIPDFQDGALCYCGSLISAKVGARPCVPSEPFLCKSLERVEEEDLGDVVRVHYRGYPSDAFRTVAWHAAVDGQEDGGSWSGGDYVEFAFDVPKDGETYHTVFSVREEGGELITSPACQNHVGFGDEPPPVEPPPPTTTLQTWIDGEGAGDVDEDPFRGWPDGVKTVTDVLSIYGVMPPDLFRDEGNGEDKVEIRYGIIDVEELPGSTYEFRRIKITNVREIVRVPYKNASKGRIISELPGDRVMFAQFGEHGSFKVFGLPQSWSDWNPETGEFQYDKADYNLIRHWGGRWSFIKDRYSGREEDPNRIFDYAAIIELELAKRGFCCQDNPVQEEMARQGRFSLWQYPEAPFEGLGPWAEQCIAALIGQELQYVPGLTPEWIRVERDGSIVDLRTKQDIIDGFTRLPGHPDPGEDWATYVLRTGDSSEWGWEWEPAEAENTDSFCPGGGDWCEA